jgi:hypothetical protein
MLIDSVNGTTTRLAVALGLAASLTAGGCAGAASPEAPQPVAVEEVGPLLVGDALLAQALRRVAERSSTWRAGLDTLAASGFLVLVTVPERAERLVPALIGYEPMHIGEVIPMRAEGGRLVGAVVTVDVMLLQRLALESGVPLSVALADVERVLIHEIYGHVVPLAQSRTLAGGCPDPGPGEAAESSCAIVRENRIRGELGLAPRTGYDLSDLALGRALEAARR